MPSCFQKSESLCKANQGVNTNCSESSQPTAVVSPFEPTAITAYAPPAGTAPSSAMTWKPILSPYHPPHPSYQDSLAAGGKPDEDQAVVSGKQRKRRMRTVYTAHQMQGLERAFEVNPYPDITMREDIALSINLTESRVQVWFQNRRARQRRQDRQTGKSPTTFEGKQIGEKDNNDASEERNSPGTSRTPPTASDLKGAPLISLKDSPPHDEEPPISDNKIPALDILNDLSPPRICTLPCCCPPTWFPFCPPECTVSHQYYPNIIQPTVILPPCNLPMNFLPPRCPAQLSEVPSPKPLYFRPFLDA